MKKLLVVVDYQNDFIDGALGFAGAEKLAPRIAARIAEARANGGDVIFTLDTHGGDYLTTSEGKKLPIPHCIKGTNGHKLYPEIAALVRDGDIVIEKPSFGSTELYDRLRDSDYTDIELCGLVTDICVVSNAILAKTALPEARVSVAKSLTATADKSKYDAALAILASVQIDVVE
ncbi:MAG TPA: cysteine hydrolase [Firmicutes bacterium]|nr:cysteine hydrolase [Bacillota bacterium]